MTENPPGPSTSRRAFLRLLGAGAGALAAGLPTAAGAAALPAGSGPSAAVAPAGAPTPATTAPRTLAARGAAPPFLADFVGVRGAASGTLRLPGGAVPLLPDCARADLGGVAATALRRVDRALAWSADSAGVPVAVNVTDGPAVRVDPVAEPQLGPLAYLDRARWGADESLRFDEQGADRWGGPPIYWPVQKLTVHHTATANDDPDPAATVRGIYYFHTIERDFGDIGYQLLIDEAGRIYEGRYSDGDHIPGHDGQLRGVQGAHVGGFNSGNIGIALLGTFTDRSPTPAARRSLVLVLAVLARLHNLDPLGSGPYVNPVNGATADVPTIPGHLDWEPTECPGRLTHQDLPSIRGAVAWLLRFLPDIPLPSAG